METLIRVKRRFFFRRDRAKPGYRWESHRVADFAKAHEFLDVEIEITTSGYGIPSQAYDALLEGRYREAQTIAMDACTPLRLTITGVLGDVVKPADARREAFDRNVSLIEDGDFPLDEANAQWGTNFRSAKSAARYALKTDGEYAGLDIVDEISEYHGKRRFERVLVGHSFGCLHDDIRDRVPELAGLIPWHQSDLNAGSPSQMRALATKEAMEAIATLTAKGVSHYDAACSVLRVAGLLDGVPGDGEIYVAGRGFVDAATYRYGSGWVTAILPDHVLASVLALHHEDLNARASDAA